ncbi:hypothetical protein SAMN05444165_0395 [Paraburkholderia phenazinium]|uniref:Uncharacterized protein n=1 Tax=Paraburkholderia phenazinium TaxID=60549 RepID=A0A1N6FU41_9BURK|nr:hypothetical protein SAMN05444165_0395 [Paraburkholderia phenazinium]
MTNLRDRVIDYLPGNNHANSWVSSQAFIAAKTPA